ncbi:MAG: NAD(P)/FAD-dependent oxidoreductase [Oscillospiraceae bacterium]
MSDIVIVGMGPAGLSAALYVRRAGLSCSIIGKDIGALSKAEKIENYFGVTTSPSGQELVEAGRAQAAALGTILIDDEVVALNWDERFTVHGQHGQYSAQAVILATGTARKTLSLPGLEAFEGKGVSYCAVCDAFFYRGMDVAVLGAGEYALHEISELLPVVGSVTLLTQGAPLTAHFPPEVKIIETPVSSLYGTTALGGVQLQNGCSMAFSGLFVALGSAAAEDLARKLGAEIESNRVVVDSQMATALPGLFAAGDCIGGLLQVSTAVGEGAKAAISAIAYVRAQKKSVSGK